MLLQVLVELTAQSWADQTLAGVHVLGHTGLPAGLPGVDVDNDPMKLAQVLDHASDRYQADIAAARSVAARRAIDSGWEPHVTVAFPDAPPEALRCALEAAVADRSGVAVVTAGPVDGARWHLKVEADGSGTPSALAGDRPFELEVRVDADIETITLLAADLTAAAEPADTPRVIDLRATSTDQPVVTDGVREVAVLGTVEVVGGPGPDAVESKRRRPGLAVLAYLATHRQPVTSAELEQALWPLDMTKPRLGGAAPSTVNNAVTVARKIVGRGPDGDDLLTFTPDGYRFADGVSTDWERFQQLAAVGTSGDPQTRSRRWTAALQLVRGVPFAGQYPGRFFDWVGSERVIDDMTARVVDAASAMADAALEAEDWDTVKWAVDKGLALDPAREELLQALMHAEGRAGKPDRVHEIYGRLCAMLQMEIDVLQTPSDTSEEIWKSYTAAGRGNGATSKRAARR